MWLFCQLGTMAGARFPLQRAQHVVVVFLTQGSTPPEPWIVPKVQPHGLLINGKVPPGQHGYSGDTLLLNLRTLGHFWNQKWAKAGILAIGLLGPPIGKQQPQAPPSASSDLSGMVDTAVGGGRLKNQAWHNRITVVTGFPNHQQDSTRDHSLVLGWIELDIALGNQWIKCHNTRVPSFTHVRQCIHIYRIWSTEQCTTALETAKALKMGCVARKLSVPKITKCRRARDLRTSMDIMGV